VVSRRWYRRYGALLKDAFWQDDMEVALSTMAMSPQLPQTAVSEPDSSDAGLVHAARSGDRRACFAIWAKYAALVQRLVWRFLGPGPDYADVCQEVFLRIFKRLDELREPAALHGFVVSVTLGVARNESRRRRIRAIVGLVPEDVLPAAPGLPAQDEAREAARALYRLLGTLNAEDRSLFVARFVEKMELTEVAAAHGMSMSTAKRRLARLVERVNTRLQSSPVLMEYVGLLGQGRDP
jgi:RNA polymerase sigma-70 factor, ECF subfamily